MLPWIAYPGIFDFAHSIGYVIGVLPTTLKSNALWVYFQMYSPSRTKYFPKACCRPAWNSLRKPGAIGVRELDVQLRSPVPGMPSWGPRTALLQPMLESTRFSLNGDSRVRA